MIPSRQLELSKMHSSTSNNRHRINSSDEYRSKFQEKYFTLETQEKTSSMFRVHVKVLYDEKTTERPTLTLRITKN